MGLQQPLRGSAEIHGEQGLMSREAVMEKPTESLFDRCSWLAYPLVAVLLGGLLGRVAGRHPRNPDPLTALSPKGFAILIDVCWVGGGLTVVAAAFCFLSGFFDERGLRRRLVNGLNGAHIGVLLILVCVGCPVAICMALAVLSLWAGMGAGPYLGALLGATSVALAIGLSILCLASLGRPAGRWIVKKKREAIADAEEDAC
jgi:hypothetical protein